VPPIKGRTGGSGTSKRLRSTQWPEGDSRVEPRRGDLSGRGLLLGVGYLGQSSSEKAWIRTAKNNSSRGVRIPQQGPGASHENSLSPAVRGQVGSRRGRIAQKGPLTSASRKRIKSKRKAEGKKGKSPNAFRNVLKKGFHGNNKSLPRIEGKKTHRETRPAEKKGGAEDAAEGNRTGGGPNRSMDSGSRGWKRS